MGNLASAVDELLAVDPRDLAGPELAEQILEARRQINRLEAAYHQLLVVFDRTGAAGADRGSTAAWVRSELHLSPAAASRDVHLARDLADVLPVTRVAMDDGDLSPAHARVIASLRGSISADALEAAEPHVVDYARQCTPNELRAVATHVRHSYAPDKVVRDERDDYERRRFDGSTTIGGMGVGSYTLHPVGQETLMTAIHALSRPTPGDSRTATQRRADALITMAEIAMRSGDLPVTGGVRPHVTVTASLATLTGQAGSVAADYQFGASSSAEWARRIACDAEISRIVFGPDGQVLDAGRASRAFTAAQRRAIVARDRTCIWSGCDTPPGWCDVHHITHWADGGVTSIDNGVLLCGRHHDRVHAQGHHITRTPDGHHTVGLFRHPNPRWLGHPHRAGP
jgi:Domain of unknown function (DUF222)/HNH endonuclease